jgi:hypothetical protein
MLTRTIMGLKSLEMNEGRRMRMDAKWCGTLKGIK